MLLRAVVINNQFQLVHILEHPDQMSVAISHICCVAEVNVSNIERDLSIDDSDSYEVILLGGRAPRERGQARIPLPLPEEQAGLLDSRHLQHYLDVMPGVVV